MLRYIPDFILRQCASGCMQGGISAYALLFDIVDFTRIGTELQKHGKQGAENLNWLLDEVFGEPIRIVESYGGFVSLFAGDAFCAIFPADRNPDIVSAVNAIAAHFSIRKGVPTCAGTYALQVRLTVTQGNIQWQIFANEIQNEYVFFGEPMRELADLSALKQNIIFSGSAARSAGISLFQPLDTGFRLASTEFADAAPVEVANDYPAETSSRFLNPKFCTDNPQPEIRSAAYCFASLEGIGSAERERAIADLEQLADSCHGLVNKLDATDKGLIAIVLFGLPRSTGKTLDQICKFSLEALAKLPQLALGISCGEVIASYTGAGNAREYTAIGHPMNLAARLMGKARAGEILTDSGFWQEFYRKYTFAYLGTLNLKGIDTPLRYYSLSSQAEPRSAWQENRFAGRETEVACIREILDRSLSSGTNAVIYVSGEPGIGKSRLVQEALAPHTSGDCHFFRIGCDAVASIPLDAVTQLVRSYFYFNPQLPPEAGTAMFRALWQGLADGDAELQRVESIIASLLGYGWSNSVWSMLPAEEKPGQLTQAILRFLRKLASEKPILLHLDDAQWLDAESLAVLRAASEQEMSPLLIVCPCRHLENGSELDLGLAKHQKHALELGNLDEIGCGELIGSILRLNQVPTATLELVTSRSMGNPLFVEQLTAYLQENGILNDKGKIITEVGYLSSFGISDIVGGRVDRLTDDVRECVTSASVLGVEFNISVLSRMLNKELVPELEDGVRNRIWRSLDELNYIFSHILIRDTIYQRTLSVKLRQLHQLAAEALVSVHAGDLDGHAAEIARHYEHAQLPEQAADYYLRAGIRYWEKSMLRRAEESLAKALAIRKEVLGEQHPQTATAKDNLANVYLSQGRYGEAGPLLKEALETRERVLGAKHPQTAASLNNLGNFHFDQADYEQAEPLYRRSLEIREQVLGAEHPDTAASMQNLANLHTRLGRLDEAERLLLRALEVQRKVWGTEHSGTAANLNNLASLYHSQGRMEQAELLFRQSLEIKEKVLGPEHPDTAATLNNLANLYNAEGKYALAEPLHLRALEIKEKVLGSEHPDTAISLGNSANLLVNLGKLEQAEPLFQRALRIWTKVFGEVHPGTAALVDSLASLYDAQDKFEQAEPLYQQAIAINEKILGAEHPTTAISIFNLGAAYINRDNLAQAEILCLQALEIWKNKLGLEHPWTVAALEGVVELYAKLGNQAKAAEYKALIPDKPAT